MSPEEQDELASLYALGLLEGDTREAFEEELRRNPGLTRLIAEYEQGAARLAMHLPRVPVPPELRELVLRRINSVHESEEPLTKREKLTTAAGWWAPWALAAVLMLFCCVLWKQKVDLRSSNERLLSERSALQVNLQRAKADLTALEEKFNKLQADKNDVELRLASLERSDPAKAVRTVVLAPQLGAPADQKLIATWDASSSSGVVNVDSLPEPPPGRAYQLWIITRDSPQPLSAGVLTAWKGRQVAFSAPRPVTDVAALAISIEPAGGSVSPQGPVVYVGRL